ncbi:DUF1592 domain-containing protein [bacterium]|nr:DUF1592 domain-containing protein [bacterium]
MNRLVAMIRRAFGIFLVLAFAGGLQAAEGVLGVFQENCISCHGKDGKVKGKVNLLEIGSLEELKAQPKLLESIVEAIDFEEMPPEDEPQLKPEARKKFLGDLEDLLHQSVAGKKEYLQSPIRRMNRFQYNNAVTDLFGLKCNVFTLPERMMRDHKGYFKPETGKMADRVTVGSRPLGKSQMIEPRLAGVAAFPQDLRAEHGYDNQADHLSLSPLLMESFLKLGQSIVESKDFGPRRVGIWKEFFLLPPKGTNPEALVRPRLEKFLTKAFRRPVTSELLDRYAGYVVGQMKKGVDYTQAMKMVSSAVISSPKFLYLYDGASEGSGKVDGFDLASRLSFFLWGSLPDEELLALAKSGELMREDVLSGQLTRMLKDRKVKRFCDSFPSQWLQLERIISSVPDLKKFPKFYFSRYRDSMHMMLEPLLLFETVLIENQSITQLIDSDFTYRSGHLEEAYGELGEVAKKKRGGVGVLSFDRVPVTDRRTGGVITNAAVMTMTSGPERTQPITRGAWIAGVIFNNPPEPPPADVPPLGEEPKDGEEHLTLRERLAMHRERADCRGCHEQIDPLGFALENYDAVGQWREKYENGRKVDMEGVLFRKHTFSNVVEFKDAVLAEKDRFTRGLAGHLLAFSLGRELGVTDGLALDKISEVTAKDGYRIQTLLREIVTSEPFLSKMNPKTK